MNIEENRLNTFTNWPRDAAVSPARIAKAGFFYTRESLIVECFCCHLQISNWNYGDQIMTRHMRLSPHCLFVVDPTTSGNVPMIPQPAILPSSSNTNLSLFCEAARLQTFENWPIRHIIDPERLARAGFYYLKEGDTTKCPFCKGVVRAWEEGDDPDSEHQRHFPRCPFVLTVINLRLDNQVSGSDGSIAKETFTNLNVVGNENLDELGVHTHKGPKRLDYATLESRLKSFTSWPNDLVQRPDSLAQAGFYYEGLSDQVRCFHCDGGLRHWDPQDDPWTEHARWFPRCFYVKLVKGQEFVAACSTEHNEGSNLEEVAQKSHTQPTRLREVSDRELHEHMTSEVALTVLNIGLNFERIQRAIKEKLQKTGRGYSQADALVEAALNLQHEEDDGSSTDFEETPIMPVLRRTSSPAHFDLCETAVKEVVEVSSAPATGDSGDKVEGDKLKKPVSLEEENRILKEARLCKICMDIEVGIVFLPCGHLATCVNCAPNLEDCPVCRSAIKATVRTFLA